MLGKGFLTFTAISLIFGPFIADFNDTHVTNPRWPPHARFHNGQTMSMGLGLGLATLYFTFRPAPYLSLHPSSPSSTLAANSEMALAAKRDDYFIAAIFGSLYWITGLSAILYPGSSGIDPEFGEGFPQLYIFLGLFVFSVSPLETFSKLRSSRGNITMGLRRRNC